MHPVTVADWSSLTGLDVDMVDEAGVGSTARLVSCRPSGPDAFTLVFSGGLASDTAQGTRLVSGPGLAPTPVFLVPHPGTDGIELQAVFTRLPSRDEH